MARYGKVSEETLELVDKIVGELNYENYMNIEAVSIAKQKQLIKVSRDSAMTEFKLDRPFTVTICIYEEAFDRLDDRQKEILLRDAINQITYDSEKDKITIGCPQITVSIDGRAKWGEELIDAAECAVHVMASIEEEEKERKRAEKEAKKSKKNK